ARAPRRAARARRAPGRSGRASPGHDLRPPKASRDSPRVRHRGPGPAPRRVYSPLPMLKQIGRYRLVRELGSDVTSATHEAVTGKGEDRSPVIVVVAKIPVRLAPEEAELFRVEVAATTEISHAHLAPVIDHGAQHGMPFVVHE